MTTSPEGGRRRRGMVALLLLCFLLALLWPLFPSISAPDNPVPNISEVPSVPLHHSPPDSHPSKAAPGATPPQTVAAPAVGSRLVVRDLGDGHTVDGLELVIRMRIDVSPGEPGSGRIVERAVRTVDGVFEVLEGQWVAVARVVTSGWTSPEQSAQEVLESTTLWVHRTVLVNGVVRGTEDAPALPMDSVVLFGVFGGATDSPLHVSESRSPWTTNWLARHGLLQKFNLGRPSADGAFRVQIPAVFGMAIVADAPDRCPAWEFVQTDTTPDTRSLTLTLRPAISISGIIRSDDGSPLKGVEVHVYITKRAAFGEIKPEQAILHQPTGGVAAIASQRRNLSALTLHKAFRTGPDGRYSGTVKMPGDLHLVAYAHGHSMSDVALGPLRADRSEVNAHLARLATPRSVRVVMGSEVVPRLSCVVSDLTLDIPQPAMAYETSEEGEFNTQWLVPGRMYSLTPMGNELREEIRKTRYFQWNSQESLDLLALSTQQP